MGICDDPSYPATVGAANAGCDCTLLEMSKIDGMCGWLGNAPSCEWGVIQCNAATDPNTWVFWVEHPNGERCYWLKPITMYPQGTYSILYNDCEDCPDEIDVYVV